MAWSTDDEQDTVYRRCTVVLLSKLGRRPFQHLDDRLIMESADKWRGYDEKRKAALKRSALWQIFGTP